MKIMQWLYLLVILLVIIITACDNPVQTEQQLDAWDNTLVRDNMDSITQLSCSPDGQRLLFTRHREMTLPILYDLTGTIKDTLDILYNLPYFNGYDTPPVYSHDAGKVIYYKEHAYYMYEFSTQTETVLIPRYWNDVEIIWSQDDQSIFYIDNDYNPLIVRQFDVETRHSQSWELPPDIYYDEMQVVPGESSIIIRDRDIKVIDDRDRPIYTISKHDLVSGETSILVDSTVWIIRTPILSDDGRLLAYFEQDTSNNMYNLKTLNMNTRQITVQDTAVYPHDYFWGHDNSTLYIAGQKWTGDDYFNGFWSLDTATGNITELNTYFDSPDFQLTWHPIEDKIIRFDGGDYYNVATLSLADKEITDVSSLTKEERLYPIWSPDGQFILYNKRGDFVKVPLAGGAVEQISSSRFMSPDLSPDGKYLAFSNHNGSYTNIIEQETNKYIDRIYNFIDPSWSPDGSKIAGYYADSLFVYAKQGEDFIKLHSCYLPYIRTVEWQKSDYPSDYPILCTVVNESIDKTMVILLDESLKNQWVFGKWTSCTAYACWMANGQDIAHIVNANEYDYHPDDDELCIRRAVTNF